VELYLYSPSMSSRRGAWLNTGTTLPFYIIKLLVLESTIKTQWSYCQMVIF